MLIRLFLVLFSFSLVTVHAQTTTEMEGNYVLKDTLSKEVSDFGGVAIVKYKVLHKELELKGGNEFFLTHIEPKGFAIDANIKGSWGVKDSVLTLTYVAIDTNDKGQEKKTTVEERYRVLNDGTLHFLEGGTGYIFRKRL